MDEDALRRRRADVEASTPRRRALPVAAVAAVVLALAAGTLLLARTRSPAW
jgi:hypothetical protein